MSRKILRAVLKKKLVWKMVENTQITAECRQIEKNVNMIRKVKRKVK